MTKTKKPQEEKCKEEEEKKQKINRNKKFSGHNKLSDDTGE